MKNIWLHSVKMNSVYLEMCILIPLLLKMGYFWITGSIPWRLMSWLLVLPGHQQPWYWQCRINGLLSLTKQDFYYLWLISVVKWCKYIRVFYVTWNKFSRSPVNSWHRPSCTMTSDIISTYPRIWSPVGHECLGDSVMKTWLFGGYCVLCHRNAYADWWSFVRINGT